MSGPWRPTGGKDGVLDGRLKTGAWNGKPIYIHVTSQGGMSGIDSARQINATPKQDRRGGSAKNGIYLSPSFQTLGPNDAWTLLFFMNAMYKDSASHTLVFSFLAQPGPSSFQEGPISANSWVQEIIYWKDIPFKEIDILYRGPNPFVALGLQNHPRQAVRAAFGPFG
jgi:hypothetical protein